MKRPRIWHVAMLSAILGAGLLPGGVGGAVTPCAIVEGTAIGAVRIGMTTRAGLAITGPPLSQQTAGNETVFTLSGPWSQMTAQYGVIERVSTRSPTCMTARGVAPGSTLAAVREAYSDATASLFTPIQDGSRLSYPLLGIAVLLRGDRVESVEVSRPERAAGARWARPAAGAPGPAPLTAAPSWVVRSSSWRLVDTTLVVTGTVENHGRPLSAFAEVNAFSPTGRLVASSDGPFYPAPLPTGGTATFEARLTIDDVVNRYTVIVRPVGSISISLGEQAVELRNPQAFVPLVIRKLRVTVQFRNMPTRFLVTAKNDASATVLAATIAVDIAGTCFIRLADQIRSLAYRGSGTVVVTQIRPGDSSQTVMGLPPDVPGGCQDLATASTTLRVLDVRIGE